jgi:NADH-quinone oxidoreductase subunit L
MIWDPDIVPWLCWILPLLGAISSLILRGARRKIRDATVVSFSFLALLMAFFMLPDLFNCSYADRQAVWFTIGSSKAVGLGMLIDPLSIILANVVAFIGLLILVYSVKYMEKDPNVARYWFFTSLFMSGMLLLVLADNFILFFVGWKMVGLCSFALISYYYGDEKEHWIGGPSPFPFSKPSRCGLKALLVTSFGDILLLGGILIIYSYAHTFNFMELLQTAGSWLALMSKTPGVLTLTSVLILAGPLAKSAQFPFHEWLPEAMAGPTPVSALIHAATMVKSGVYLVARILPVFFFACWNPSSNYPEALTFFIIVAVAGAFTAFMAGTQALVSLELKKALAYSTMSVIGYMMLALGTAGLSPGALVDGVASGIFHLINHGIFKASLFLCAGIVIHASGSIYLSEMGLSKNKMRLTWIFMWTAALSLIGVPPLSGFWSKDEVLLSCWQSGQYALFTVALVTIVITTLYVVRFMGMIFHSKASEHAEEKHGEERNGLFLVPLGLLSSLTVALGLAGPWINNMIHEVFSRYFFESLKLPAVNGTYPPASTSAVLPVDIFLALDSILMVLIGIVPAYRLFISHKTSSEMLVNNHKSLKALQKFVWNRWYINAFYNKIFVNGMLSLRNPLVRYVEGSIDHVFNVSVPSSFQAGHKALKKIQTGILSVNMLLMMAFMVAALLILWWLRLL